MLSNAYFLAKFRFDTAENEPAKNLQNFRKCIFRKCIFLHFSALKKRKGHARRLARRRRARRRHAPAGRWLRVRKCIFEKCIFEKCFFFEHFSKILQIFNGLVLGCIKTKNSNFARKYAFDSIFQALEDVHIFVPLQTQHFSRTSV